MARPPAIPRIDDHSHALVAGKMLEERSRCAASQVIRGEEGPKSRNLLSRPFFSRWLDHWKDRNEAVKR